MWPWNARTPKRSNEPPTPSATAGPIIAVAPKPPFPTALCRPTRCPSRGPPVPSRPRETLAAKAAAAAEAEAKMLAETTPTLTNAKPTDPWPPVVGAIVSLINTDRDYLISAALPHFHHAEEIEIVIEHLRALAAAIRCALTTKDARNPPVKNKPRRRRPT
jgi:hypothetical protein